MCEERNIGVKGDVGELMKTSLNLTKKPVILDMDDK